MAAKDNAFVKLAPAGKLGILFIILAVLAGGYYFAVHMPLTEEIDAEAGKYRRLQTEMTAAQDRQREYLKVQQEIAAREVIDRANKRVLPENAEMPAFLADLARLAELAGLRIKGVEPKAEEVQELYVRLPAFLKLEGRFFQFAKFLNNVGKLERAINLENVELTEPKLTPEGEIVLTIEVLGTAFRRPAPDEAQAGGQDKRKRGKAAAKKPPAKGGAG